MSTQAFYCSLCDVFLGSCTCVETHCKTDEHNEKYTVSIVSFDIVWTMVSNSRSIIEFCGSETIVPKVIIYSYLLSFVIEY